MTKLSGQFGNSRFTLEFESREGLDDFVLYLVNGSPKHSDNLNAIADAITKERMNTNSIKDIEFIPQIIDGLNTHLKNVGDLTKFGSKRITSFTATTLTFNKDKDEWEADNGYTFNTTLRYMLMWFTEIAPEYWNRK